MTKIIPWKYNNELFELKDDQIKQIVAFVYLVTHVPTGRKYVGKKYLWKKITRPPLKGKTRKRTEWKQSDWSTYTTSCEDLKNLLTQSEDLSEFSFDILHLCSTKGESSYIEAKEQFERDVLRDSLYWNNIIQCRIHSKHLAKSVD